jgi:hypothetical protein
MPPLPIEYRDEAQRLALEQAIASIAHLHQLAYDAPDGTVLATALAGPHRRRRATRGAARLCPDAHRGRHKGRHARTVLTAVGPLTLCRSYFACPRWGQGTFAEAEGDLELQVDAGKANTLEGWRDVKVAVFAEYGLSVG